MSSIPAQSPKPALFLDRDGVINVDHGYVGTRERFEWIFGAREAIALATAQGWLVFVATNQSGVARGYYTEDDVRALHRWMTSDLASAGGIINDIRYCPYHPDATIPAYRRVSDWRKPAPGMILDLLRTWNLDPARALLIGDQDTDLLAASAAGIRGAKFSGGNLETFLAPLLGRGPMAFAITPST